jgi:hypothetical protein
VSSASLSDRDDHVHQSCFDEGGEPTPFVLFNYDALDPAPNESVVPMGEATSAFVKVLDWLASSHDFRFSGARVHLLHTILDPVHARYRSMAEIARASDITRACLSKAYQQLRDSFNFRPTGGKLDSSRESYRQAAFAALRNGTHASNVRKDLRDREPQPEENMNASKIRTLDAAIAKIQELESQLATAPKPVPATPPPTIATPVPEPAKPAPRLEDLSTAALKAALDISNHNRDSEMVHTLYNELKRRRKQG